MNIVDIILKKRNGEILSPEEISFFVSGVKEKTLPDYQISALLMAIFFRGLSKKETSLLTKEMARSGDRLSFPEITDPIVDKHSSGGVGDKTSLVIAPVVAACGLPIAKLSGRGLGFTGGTVDKLESIPGFRTEISKEDFIRFVQEDGISIIGQSGDIAPVDKVLYALRDVTGTVDSIPLIAASIMSKKLADGSDAIVLDVKYGSGAFMKSPEKAIELAREMVAIGEDNHKRTIALVTDMDQPLGSAVGNNLEVIEAIETLQGHGPEDFRRECQALVEAMLMAGGKCETRKEAGKAYRQVIEDGSAFRKFRKMVENQGGDVSYIDDPEKFPKAPLCLEARAEEAGFVTKINAEEIGKSSLLLGAGRLRTEDTINPAVGLRMERKVNDPVAVGDVLFRVYAQDEKTGIEAMEKAKKAYRISEEKTAAKKMGPVIALVSKEGVEERQGE